MSLKHIASESLTSEETGSGIFKFTEPVSFPSVKPKLSDIVNSCEELRGGVAMSWRGLNRDVRKSMEDYTSTMDKLNTFRLRKWRSLARYSSRRNHIIAMLSTKSESMDQENVEAFTELLFPKKKKEKSSDSRLSKQFKFTAQEILSPRMQQLLKTNQRPFGGAFSSLTAKVKHEKKKEFGVPDSLAQFIQEEIGKYQTNRMDRLLRVSSKTKPGKSPKASLRIVEDGQKQKLSFLMLKKRLPIWIHRKNQLSETPEVERAVLIDAQQSTKDMRVKLRTERILVGSQAVDLSQVKTFKANLKHLLPTE